MATNKNNAKLPDIQSLINAGIDPKTGLPIKMGVTEEELTSNIRKILRVIDRQDAIRRYTWYNLPSTLNGELLERILYYRGQGMFFYMKSNDEFYFLPYALSAPDNSTGLDVYGRYTGVTPIPFNGTSQLVNKKESPWITGLIKKPVYGFPIKEDIEEDEVCVLLHDYCKDVSQTTLPRQNLNEPILRVMSECIPYMRTSLILGSGVEGMRVNDADQERTVAIASKQIKDAALNGQAYIPIVGTLEFQDLAIGPVNKSQEYMLAFQSLDNFRLATYGLDNGGVFEKQGTVLSAEEATNGGNTQLIYEDGLTIRQQFCDIVNAIWGLGIWCEASDAATADAEMSEEQGKEVINEESEDRHDASNVRD